MDGWYDLGLPGRDGSPAELSRDNPQKTVPAGIVTKTFVITLSVQSTHEYLAPEMWIAMRTPRLQRVNLDRQVTAQIRYVTGCVSYHNI